MASAPILTSGGETDTIYTSPVSTLTGSTITAYFTDSVGETTATMNLMQATTLYTTLTSLIEGPTPIYYTSTITSESIISTFYVPISTVRTVEDGRTVTSILYGQSGISTAFTIYVTATSLPTTSSLASGLISIVPTSNSISSGAAPAHLSTGAKAGIGIGVTFAILIFAAIVSGWFIIQKRRRRRPQLSEVASSGQGAYDKPELDATEVLDLSDGHTSHRPSEKPDLKTSELPPCNKTERNEVELDATKRPGTDGRAELEGRMVPKVDVIRRKEVGIAKAQSLVEEKEVMHEK